jgi:hypothetical protein
MENVVELKSWDEFSSKTGLLISKHRDLVESEQSHVTEFLFRGQPDYNFPLQSTFERRKYWSLKFSDYFRLAHRAKPEVETFAGERWEMPDYPRLLEWCENYDSLSLDDFPAYEYLVYLRHHGFPSPLIDWSASPYIAAFFAFSSRHAVQADKVSIYQFREKRLPRKQGSSDNPQIKKLGPYVRSHRRHYLQQSHYTICGRYVDGEWQFAPHEEVFDLDIPDQDILTKYTLPASERSKVLRELHQHGLNAYSLFQNEEALLETIAYREFDREH